MSNTANRSFLLAASKIIVIVLNAVLLMLLSRIFSISYYGIYKELVLKESLISIIGEMGLTSAAIYFISGKKSKEYLSGIINISFILIVISIPISFYFSPIDGIGRILFVLIVLLKLLTITSTNMMIAAGKNRLLVLYTIIPPLVTVTLVVVMGLTTGTLLFLLVILVTRRVVETVISVTFWFKIGNPFRLASRKVLSEILLFSLPLAVSSVVGILNMNVDKLMVKYFFTIEQFAIFSNGAYELPVLQIFAGSLFTVMIPKLKSLKDENRLTEVVKTWNNLGEITSTIIIPLTVVLIFFADTFVVFMFSDKYIESINIFRIYQIKNLFRIYLYGSIFVAFAENRKLMINSIISLVMNTILNLIFIRLYGINGIPAATVLSLLFLVLLQCYQISRFLNIKIHNTYPYAKWLAMIALSIPVTYAASKLSLSFHLTFKVVIMIIATGINFILVSILFNRTILNFIVKKLKGRF